MRRRWLVAALALFAAVVLVLPSVANARLRPLFAAMSEPNVAPGPPTHQGGGSFTAVIDDCASPAAPASPNDPCPVPADEPWFCYGIALKDLRSPLLVGRYTAHVHLGDAGTIGKEVIELDAPWTVNPGSSNGCIRLDATLAAKIAGLAGEIPGEGGVYVDVHSLHDLWAARGQIFAIDPAEIP